MCASVWCASGLVRQWVSGVGGWLCGEVEVVPSNSEQGPARLERGPARLERGPARQTGAGGRRYGFPSSRSSTVLPAMEHGSVGLSRRSSESNRWTSEVQRTARAGRSWPRSWERGRRGSPFRFARVWARARQWAGTRLSVPKIGHPVGSR